MKTYVLILLFVSFCSSFCVAQDSIVKISEVVVSDRNLKKYSTTKSTQVISDTLINRNKPSLTSLLNYNTLLYFKEYGLGMTSSVSFRGTTAGQTAVIWNGININSQLLGQTDFNTVSTNNYNAITVRSGGGSVLYGSSAIGGSIHLNNDLIFKPLIENKLHFQYGSFDTKGINYNATISNNVVALNIGVSRNESQNDFTFPETDIKNSNGDYYNNALNISFGYQWLEHHTFKIYSQFYDGERHFSPALSSVSNSKYQNLDHRNLVEWHFMKNKFTSSLKFAFLKEAYKYFENKDISNFSFGKAETTIFKYNIGYQFSNKIDLDFIADYSKTSGLGSDIFSDTRKITSFAFLYKHQIAKRFLYDFSLRKEITNQYESPLLFSIGTVFQPFSFYKILINGSKNFRIPSFDDLYWIGSGNPNLQPETALQAELSNDFFYKGNSLKFTVYKNKVSDLIRWNPNENGQWTPENVESVSIYGAEVVLNVKRSFGKHNIDLMSSYGYTKSVNQKINKQLIYVPFHKSVTTLTYRWKSFKLENQLLYNGKVFTSSDNLNKLKAYQVFNSGIHFEKKYFGIGFQLSNLFNENYQNVLGRPLPGRNYTITINLNF